MQATPLNLKRYFGIPVSETLLSSIQGYKGSCWLDHLKIEKWEDKVVLISEPYHMVDGDYIQLRRLCDDFKLDYMIDGQSTYNPGRCLRITLWRRGSGRKSMATGPHAGSPAATTIEENN